MALESRLASHTSFATHLAGLNPQQRAAVHYLDGPLLVLAGAGSGKTSVITHKIAWLSREAGIATANIAAVTFTNKAAREMKTRLGAMLGSEAARALTVSTFHSLGLSILRAHLGESGRREGFSIYDADDSATLAAKLMRAKSGRSKKDAKFAPEQVQWQISRWKNALVAPDAALGLARDGTVEPLAARVYAEYEEHLKAYNAFDFDDLILKPTRLLEAFPAILAKWRNQIRYLLVDEYQDTNGCQYGLVKLLVGERGAFTVVGDDDQSIYAWRGAQAENLQLLQRDFPALKVIKLEQNYRSTGRILRAANALIANNPHLHEKKLWSAGELGEPLRVLKARNEEHEAERVVGEIMHHKFKHDGRFRDYAILYRENHQSRLLERFLRERRIPYFLSGGMSFFERSEIKDMMSYLRLLVNADDDAAFLRIVNTPRREIGPATLEGLGQHAASLGVGLLAASFDFGLAQRLNARQLATLRAFTHWMNDMIVRAREEDEPMKVVNDLLEALHYDDWLKEVCDDDKTAQRRMENVLELVSWLRRLSQQPDVGGTLADMVARLSLIGMLEKDGENDATDQVSLMTLHAAKGLEFPHVFIVGTEENILPHHGSQNDRGVEEERRLAYVGITRAKKTLTMFVAERRRRGGELVACEPSRFIGELPADDVVWADGQTRLPPQPALERAEDYLSNMRNLLKNPV
jgi:ATP-dependent DNA helicase Rep